MVTRAQIFIKNKENDKRLAIYHHFNGYLEGGLGGFLRYYIKTPKNLFDWIDFILNQSWNEHNSPNYVDYLNKKNHYLKSKILKMNQFMNLADNIEPFYSSYSKPEYGDLEFIYFINFDDEKVKINYLDLYEEKLVDWRTDMNEDDLVYYKPNIDELFEISKSS